MDNNNLSKEELIQNLEHLQRLNKQLLKEKEQETKLEYAWSGNLGHWYWDIKTNKVTFNALKVTTLGYAEEEIPNDVDYQFFTEKLHPDDYEKAMRAMRDHLYGKSQVYEVEYRIQAKDKSYKWYYDRGKITQYDKNNKPVMLAGIVFDITQKKLEQLRLEKKNSILAKKSSIDGLTQISNHKTLLEGLKEQKTKALRDKTPLSLAMFDIDDFKKVNDTKGHIYGDKVLKQIAKIIKQNIREKDQAGRYGGEEFMVVFPKTEATEAYKIAERIRKTVEKSVFIDSLKITISGGVKELNAENQEIFDLIHAADVNLYKAKRHGKNRIF